MDAAQTANTQSTRIASGTTIAYRIINPNNARSHILIMIPHFRSNMDHWDPVFINKVASTRPVLLYDPAGIGRSSGSVPTTFQGWADDALALVDALAREQVQGLNYDQIDVLGFSMGGAAAQMVALTAPSRVRRALFAGTTASRPPKDFAGQGSVVWPREEPPSEPFRKLATAVTDGEVFAAFEDSFFNGNTEATLSFFERVKRRQQTSLEPVMLGLASTSAVGRRQIQAFKHWSEPNPENSFERLGELAMPVLVMNGDDDRLIPTSRSWELLRGIPNAKLVLFPNAGHGFLSQHANAAAQEITLFLDEQHSPAKL